VKEIRLAEKIGLSKFLLKAAKDESKTYYKLIKMTDKAIGRFMKDSGITKDDIKRNGRIDNEKSKYYDGLYWKKFYYKDEHIFTAGKVWAWTHYRLELRWE
jgi:hypothetical protein